jgi:hypothetical protein
MNNYDPAKIETVDPWVCQAADIFPGSLSQCTDAEVLKEIGRQCIERGDNFRAEESIRRALAIDSRDHEAWLLLAQVYEERLDSRSACKVRAIAWSIVRELSTHVSTEEVLLRMMRVVWQNFLFVQEY